MTSTRFRPYTPQNLGILPAFADMPADVKLDLRAVSSVFPFRSNAYVVEELIDWGNIPNDPIYQLTFPQPGMLSPSDLALMRGLIASDAPQGEIKAAARVIQMGLNPHPAGQRELNVPRLDGHPTKGMQHKYRETVLFFPTQGQTCHAYCTYCFRWAQFVGLKGLKFASKEAEPLVRYLEGHPGVTDVLFTGGDPLIMKTAVLRRYIEPLIKARPGGLTTIRLGTKAPAYWPQRFVTDNDADDLLRLFEEVRASGLNLAVMAHYSHPRELSTPIAQQALRRIQSTGAVVRCQAPLMRHINDSAEVWREMWRLQVRLGAVPYYMFVSRDTGPRDYFEIPLVRALGIFKDAWRSVSGLGRTVRGPSMSTTAGKIMIVDDMMVGDRRALLLQMLQCRDSEMGGRAFFARYDARATWITDLRPLEGDRFFFESPRKLLPMAGNYEPIVLEEVSPGALP